MGVCTLLNNLNHEHGLSSPSDHHPKAVRAGDNPEEKRLCDNISSGNTTKLSSSQDPKSSTLINTSHFKLFALNFTLKLVTVEILLAAACSLQASQASLPSHVLSQLKSSLLLNPIFAEKFIHHVHLLDHLMAALISGGLGGKVRIWK